MYIRRASFYSTEVRAELAGSEPDMDNQIEALESLGGWRYVFTETATLGENRPLSPIELQSATIERSHFTGRSETEMYYRLGYIGVHTYADVLALGKKGLREHAHNLTKQGFRDRAIGQKTISVIERITQQQVFHRLPAMPAPPEQWHQYYYDIRAASPTIALPLDGGLVYRDIYLNWRKVNTIGSLITDAKDEAFWGAHILPDLDGYQKLIKFTSVGLPQIVSAFNAGQHIPTPKVALEDS